MKQPPLSTCSNAASSPHAIASMFGEVASKYDFLNHLLSGGLDFFWRSFLVRQVKAQKPNVLLDLATGSGDVLRALRKANAVQTLSIGADFCAPMLRLAQKKGLEPLCLADALNLPFEDQSLDAITIAFGFRNFADRPASLREFLRTLKPGGALYLLEFSQPQAWLKPFYFWHLKHVLPLIAGLFTTRKDAYAYLAESIEAFPSATQLARELAEAGFQKVETWRLSCGLVALHQAWK